MKPNFALNLSLDGIDLFHRSKTGWSHVGTVALDDPDLAASLSMLRASAVSLAAGSLTTKVIIPESQILYTEVEVEPAGGEAAREATIRAGLEGRTPYPVADLVFDSRPRGRKVELAVLARETLAEAEAFARDHRFNPVSFVAAPAGGRFGGAEPFFGLAASARETIEALGAPEREAEALDLDALKRVRAVPEPKAEPVPVAAEPPAPPAEGSGEAEPPTPTFSSRRAARRAERQATKVEAAPPARPKPSEPPLPGPERPSPRLVASKPDFPPPPPPRLVPQGEPVPLRRPPPVRAPADAPVAVKAFLRNAPASARKTPVIDLGNLRALKGQAGSGAAAPALQLAPDPEPEEAPVADTARTVFGARREAVERRSPIRVVVLTLVLLLVLATLALWSTFWQDSPDPDAAATLAPVDGALATPEPDPAAAPSEVEAEAALPSAAAAPAPGAVAEADVPAPEADVPDAAAAPDTAEAEPALPAPDPALPDDPAAAALDRADAGRSPPADVAAAPPAAAAAPEGALPDASAAAAEVEVTAPAVAEAPAVEDEALADGEPEAVLDAVPDTPALPADPVTELVGTDEGAAERVRAQLAGELTPEVAASIYAASGLWVIGPAAPADPGEERTDDIQIAAIDPAIAGQDAVALPGLATDRPILSPLPPAAAGTRFDMDERGLVRATPEGAVNPDGIVIYQGRPPVAPAPRDPAIAPAAPEAPADPALAEPEAPLVRPRPRPADLSETTERALLGGRTLADLSLLRPRERPAAVLAAATAPAGTAPVLAPASDLAVARSLTPRLRSGEIVALAAASRAMAAPPVVEAAAAAPPPAKPAPEPEVAEADAEIEVASAAVVAPGIPTKASVAKTATVANAINLSKINLIGVYGTQSQRRALVRLSSGKYVKVKVGDRVDGGQVAAIGDSSLIYLKGGNQVKLSLPNT